MIDHYPEVSLQETSRLLREELGPNFDELGLEGELADAGHLAILLAFVVDGLLVRELAPAYVAATLDLDPEFCINIFDRIRELGLESSQSELWICDKEDADIVFLLDVMAIAGTLDRTIIEGEVHYRTHSDDPWPVIRDPDVFYPGEKVVHKSGKGSGWYIKEVGVGDEGQQLVKLIKSKITGGDGGRWRDASNYVKANG